MAGTAPFFIPDTSAIFAYSDGWIPSYRPKGNGYDETFHETLSGNDTISFNLTASSLSFSTPQTTAIPPACDIQYRINGSVWTDGCIAKGLPAGWHGVDVKPKSETGMQFLGISGNVRLGNEDKYRNSTIDNLSSQFTYSKDSIGWTSLNAGGLIGVVQNQTLAGMFGDRGSYNNQSLAVSSDIGAKAELKFKGAVVYLYGIGGGQMGSAGIVLDGKNVATVNMTLPWRSYSSLLFTAGGLDASIDHTLSLTNLIDGRIVLIDYAIVTSPGYDKDMPNLGLILGTAAGGVTLCLIICVLLYLLISRRRSRPQRSSGKSHRSSPSHPTSASWTDTPKSIDAWRKNSTSAISPISPVSLSFSLSTTSGSARKLINTHRTPLPKYNGDASPGYIPYNGPVEPRPSYHSNGRADISHAPPPDIVGASASASSWLLAQAKLASSRTSSYRGGGASQRSVVSPASNSIRSGTGSRKLATPTSSGSAYDAPSSIRHPPPVRRLSHDTEISSLDVPFTAIDYYSRRHGPVKNQVILGRGISISPNDIRLTGITDLYPPPSAAYSTTTPSSVNSDPMSARNATIGQGTTSRNTFARILPSTTNTSPVSDFNTSMARGIPIPHTRSPRINLSPNISVGSNMTRSASANTYTTAPPSAVPSSAAINFLPRDPYVSPRRGPYIKSARSFFSNRTPPVQSQSRPESDLFDDSLSMRGSRPSLKPSWSGRETVGVESGQRGPGNVGVGSGGGVSQLLRLRESEDAGPRNMFIELNPNSPMTIVSRSGSDFPL